MSKVWSNINTKLTSRQVAVELPRIKIEAGYSLDRQLQELGIKQAFLDGFNFPGIANEKLRISNVIHKTFLEVNEKGTEAAAVTGIEMGVTSMPEYEEFRVNRPFVFVISEKSTGAILFAGKVEKPV
jgi:serpin B